MATEVIPKSHKTWATPDNVRNAIAKLPNIHNNQDLRYFIMPDGNGRYFPVFIGERAVQAGVHFAFSVIG